MAPATERLFFAIRPDAPTALRIEALGQSLRRDFGLRGKSLGSERFHVTLHLIGDFADGIPPHMMSAALEAARPVAALAAAFYAGFDRVASFPRAQRNRPLVLLGEEGVQGIVALQQALLHSLAAAHLAPRQGRPFTPHMTLLYDDIPIAPRRVEALIWKVRELLLVRSLLGRGRHEVMARLPLGG